MLKKIFNNSLIFAVGPQLPKVASIFVLPIITKDLTALDYGVAAVILAYTGLLGGIKDLGLTVNLSNIFFRFPLKWKLGWRQIHGYISAWSGIYALLQGLLLFFIIPLEANENRIVIIFLYSVSGLVFDTTITIGSRFYQFSQKPLYMAIVSAIVGVLAIALNLITISFWKMGYMGWFVSTFASSALSFVLYFYPVYFKYKLTPIFRFKWLPFLRQLRISLPVVPHNYSSYLLGASDRMVMSVLGINLSKIGVYNVANSFGSYFEFAGSAVGMAVGPIYTKLYALKREEEVRILTFFLQFCFLFGSFLLALWLKEIFVLLIKNDDLQQGYYLGIIILMGYNYRPMYWTVVNKLSFYEKTTSLWKISFIAGAVSVILNFILVPIYGYSIAALNSFVALMYIGFSGFFLPAYRKLGNNSFYPILWMAVIICVTILVYLLKDTSLIYKSLITIATMGIAGIVFLKYRYLLKISIE